MAALHIKNSKYKTYIKQQEIALPCNITIFWIFAVSDA